MAEFLALVQDRSFGTPNDEIAFVELAPEEIQQEFSEQYRGRIVYRRKTLHRLGNSIYSQTAHTVLNDESRQWYCYPGGNHIIVPVTDIEVTKIVQEIAEHEQQTNERIRAARREKVQAEAERRRRIFEKAAKTGQPQVLEQTAVPCRGGVAECSFDVHTVYALPDGSIREDSHHCF